MNCRKIKIPTIGSIPPPLLLIVLAVLLSVTSCARKPWRDPLAEDRRTDVLQALADMRRQDAARPACVDADVKIFYTSRVANRAVSGYVQMLQPSYVKFISMNPLDQPMLVFVSDGEYFQYVNTLDRLFLDGKVTAFAEHYKVPQAAFSQAWGTWLTARLPLPLQIAEIRQDSAGSGVWIETESANEEITSREHLLIDLDKQLLLRRIFTDDAGKIQARIDYSEWFSPDSGGDGRQPGKITISELDYGGKILFEFSSAQMLEDCTEQDFSLRRPPAYRYQPL